MKIKFKKVKTEHHILEDFHKLLLDIEKIIEIQKIIPWRVDRKQKWSSEKRFRVSYTTESWIKCIISKGSTAQELFIICEKNNKDSIKKQIQEILTNHKEITHTFKAIREF